MPFSSFQLHPSLIRGIQDLGFARPTPIQEAAMPSALEGRDVLACASTGSGKTAAFLLPILHRLMTRPRGTTRVLILSPTRELAAQIDEHRIALAKHTPITGAAVFGGVGMGPQETAFRRGVDIIVATPGRLLDHLRQGARLDGLEVLVLDEADRMLDMGFLPDIRRVLAQIPAKRQTLFFSATMPAPIVALTREMLRDPATVNLAPSARPASGITQALYPVPENLKSALFVELVQRGVVRNAIVFCRTKHRANRLSDVLARAGIAADRIHGNRSQTQRTAALEGFKDGTSRVLVATDIVARGIDVKALEHVVNFDVPHVAEDYVHRVGRTARAEATGDAITLVSPHEEDDLRAIERAVGRQIPRLKLEGFDYHRVSAERLEVPIAERIAEIRARKAADRRRAAEKAARRTGSSSGASPSVARTPAAPGRSAPSGPSGHGASGGGHGHAAPRGHGGGVGGSATSGGRRPSTGHSGGHRGGR